MRSTCKRTAHRQLLLPSSEAASSSAKRTGGFRAAAAPERWPALLLFLEDGRAEMDNNAAERALRAVTVGRKRYLFAQSDAGGKRAAAIYSLL